ncbi:hypothetical protein EVAR_38024_1 [Eumeta japonica]|uniref:Uncharacterized protein n=1 Tax=Eumeta variegata TaxID=151549 RepID=A0A4C1W8M8_EUMVA|nr:hypothetical protein EVAR_38024_1 [Eumeta japonica]
MDSKRLKDFLTEHGHLDLLWDFEVYCSSSAPCAFVSVWFGRVKLHVMRSSLLRTQRPTMTFMTKAYRSMSTHALLVLAGALPADLEVIRCGKVESKRGDKTNREIDALKQRTLDSACLPCRSDRKARMKEVNCIPFFRTSGKKWAVISVNPTTAVRRFSLATDTFGKDSMK